MSESPSQGRAAIESVIAEMRGANNAGWRMLMMWADQLASALSAIPLQESAQDEQTHTRVDAGQPQAHSPAGSTASGNEVSDGA